MIKETTKLKLIKNETVKIIPTQNIKNLSV